MQPIKRIAAFVIFLFCAEQSWATVSLVAHTQAMAVSTVTTSAIDTTGANFIVIGVSAFSNPNPVLSDSKGNSYTCLTPQSQVAASATLCYVANATVGTGHTFTNTVTSNFSVVSVAAFSGVLTSSPFDVQNGGTIGSSATIQTGSVTPGHTNELLVTCIVVRDSGDPSSIDSSFIITDHTPQSGGANEGGALAYKIQTSINAENPTWTNTASSNMAAVIATFQAAPAGTTRKHRGSIL